MKSRKGFKWIFIYGPPRTGSTYLLRQIRNHSIHSVSDWGLGSILKPFNSMPGGIDKKKFLEDLTVNLLSRSQRNSRGHFDLVLKAANGNLEEFQCYKEMFGQPERIIFTIREPSGYMSSAHKKFPNKTLSHLQRSYLRMMKLYQSIGGEILDYSPLLSTKSYRVLLHDLGLIKGEIERFQFKGSKADDLVNDRMIGNYRNFIRKNREKAFKL